MFGHLYAIEVCKEKDKWNREEKKEKEKNRIKKKSKGDEGKKGMGRVKKGGRENNKVK